MPNLPAACSRWSSAPGSTMVTVKNGIQVTTDWKPHDILGEESEIFSKNWALRKTDALLLEMASTLKTTPQQKTF